MASIIRLYVFAFSVGCPFLLADFPTSLLTFKLVFNHRIDDILLQTVHGFKYLGVVITCNLSWNRSSIVKKASAKLWSLKGQLKHCKSSTELVIYSTLVHPVLECVDVVWEPATKVNIE